MKSKGHERYPERVFPFVPHGVEWVLLWHVPERNVPQRAVIDANELVILLWHVGHPIGPRLAILIDHILDGRQVRSRYTDLFNGRLHGGAHLTRGIHTLCVGPLIGAGEVVLVLAARVEYGALTASFGHRCKQSLG